MLWFPSPKFMKYGNQIVQKVSIDINDLNYLNNWGSIQVKNFLSNLESQLIIEKVEKLNWQHSYIHWAKMIGVEWILYPISEYTRRADIDEKIIQDPNLSYSEDFWCTHGVLYGTSNFTVQNAFIEHYSKDLFFWKKTIEENFANLESAIFNIIGNLTGKLVFTHPLFPSFIIRKSIPNIHAKFIGHNNPHFDNGSYISVNQIWEVKYNWKIINSEYFFSKEALEGLYIGIILIQAPESWGWTRLFNKFISENSGGTMNYSLQENIETKLWNGDLLIFNALQMHQINSFIGKSERIICTFHIKVNKEWVVVYY